MLKSYKIKARLVLFILKIKVLVFHKKQKLNYKLPLSYILFPAYFSYLLFVSYKADRFWKTSYKTFTVFCKILVKLKQIVKNQKNIQ